MTYTVVEPEQESTALDYAREQVASAVHAPDHYIDVITLACALTYRLDGLNSAARILALGEKGSGKSTVLTVASFLARDAGTPTGVTAMTAPSYISDYKANPNQTPVLDEINHLFGAAGTTGTHSKFYTYINQGYNRRTAVAQYQENKMTTKVKIFGVVFMAGLGLAAPPDMRERSILLKMQKAPATVQVADFSDERVVFAFEYAARCLASWASSLPRLSLADVRGLHPKLNHRVMEVWGPLFALAMQAGDVWGKRIMTAFERIELDAGIPCYTPDIQIRLDYLKFSEVLGSSEGIRSGQFAEWACSQDHGAYISMKKGQFAQFAVRHLGPTAPFYDGETTVRGWSDSVHQMNLSNARRTAADVEKRAAVDEDDNAFEDF
jgi:hypothetical protein